MAKNYVVILVMTLMSFSNLLGQQFLQTISYDTPDWATSEGVLQFDDGTVSTYGYYLRGLDIYDTEELIINDFSSGGYVNVESSLGTEMRDEIKDAFQIGQNIYYCGLSESLTDSPRRFIVYRTDLQGGNIDVSGIGANLNAANYGDITYYSAAVAHDGALLLTGAGFSNNERKGLIQRVNTQGGVFSAGLFDEIFAGNQRLISIRKVVLRSDGLGYYVIGTVLDGLYNCPGDIQAGSVAIVRTDLNFNALPGSQNYTIIGGDTNDRLLDAIETSAGNLVLLGESQCIADNQVNGPGGVCDFLNDQWIWSSAAGSLNMNVVTATTSYLEGVFYIYYKDATHLVQACDQENKVVVLSHRSVGVGTSNNWYALDVFDVSSGELIEITASIVTGEEGEAIPTGIIQDASTGNYIVSLTERTIENFEVVNTNFGLSYFDPGQSACSNCTGAIPIECGQTVIDHNAEYFDDFRIGDYSNCHQSSNQFDAPDVLYQFNKEDNNGDLTITLTPETADLDIFLFNVCPDGGVANFNQINCIGSSIEPDTNVDVISIPNATAGDYYLIVDGYDAEQVTSYTLSVECCSPVIFDENTNSDCSQSYEFSGVTETDLSYLFTADSITHILFNEPWVVNGEEASTGFLENFFQYTFPETGTYEVCFPYLNEIATLSGEAFDCDIEYCCTTYCIESQPANLEGLVYCPNDCCAENDPFLPNAFQCDNFDQYDPEDFFVTLDEKKWVGDGFLSIINEGGTDNFMRVQTTFDVATTGINLRLQTGKSNQLGDGRYRISCNVRTEEIATIQVVDNYNDFIGIWPINYAITFENDVIKVSRDALPDITYEVAYPVNNWFEVAQVVELNNGIASVELFLNRNFVGAFTVPMETIGYVGFPNYFLFGREYDIDNICVRTVPFSPQSCVSDQGENVCLPFGSSYDNACAAGQLGLYASGEYGPCFSVCNFGGTLVSRSDGGALYSGQLTATDLAPNLLYLDQCLINLYEESLDLPVPDTLYADIYTFENDETELLIVENLPPGFYPLLYECICDENGCTQSCVEPDFGSLTEFIIEPDGYYYLVIVGEQTGSYGFQLFPIGICEVETNNVLICGDDPNGQVTTTTLPVSFGTESQFSVTTTPAYSECYNGFRTYEGADEVYRLDVSAPSFLSFDLNVFGGTGAMFIFSNICGESCYAYLDNRIFTDTASVDSLRFGEGTYYLVFDQDIPVDSMSVTITCAPDVANVDGGFFQINNMIYDIGGCSATIAADSHIVSLNPALNTSPLFPIDAQLSLEYLRYSPEGEIVRGGLNDGRVRILVDEINQGGPFLFTPPLNDNADCGFQEQDSLVLTARNGNTFTTYNFTNFDTLNFSSTNKFEIGGVSGPRSIKADSAASLDVLTDQLVFTAAEFATATCRVQGSFIITSKPDWLTILQLEYPIPQLNRIVIVADEHLGTVPRTGEIVLQSTFTPPILQTVSVIQYTACQEADLAVLPQAASVCLGDSLDLQLTNNGNTNLQQYDVYLNGQILSGPDYKFAPTQSGNFTITISDKAPGCNVEDHETISISVVPGIQPPNFAAVGLGSCSTDLTTYTTSFNTGQTIQSSNADTIILNPDGSFLASGIPAGEPFSVTLTNGICSQVFTSAAPDCSCPVAPVPVLNYTDTILCATADIPPLNVILPDGYTAVWLNAAGDEVGNEQEYIPDETGIYGVYFQNNAFSVCNGDTVFVSVNRLTNVEARLVVPAAVCQGDEVIATIENVLSSDLLPLSYRWNGVRTDSPTFSFTAQTAGPQMINLSIEYNDDGNYLCGASFAEQIAVVPTPTITTLPLEPCTADTTVYQVQFIASVDSIAVNTGTLLQTDTSYIVANIPISDTLRVVVFDTTSGLACPSANFVRFPPEDCSCPSNVLAYELPFTNIDFCANEGLSTITLPDSVGFTPQLTYLNTGEIIPLSMTDNSFFPPDTGRYRVQIISNATGCLGFALYDFSIRYLDEISAEISNVLPVCLGEPIRLEGNQSLGNALSYNWSGVAGVILDPTEPITDVESLPVGFHEFQLHITDLNGCRDSTSITVEVLENPSSALTIIDSIACFGDSTGTILSSISGGVPPYTYVWNNIDTTDQQVLFDLGTGQYKLTVIDNNQCIDSIDIFLPQPPALLADSVVIIPSINGNMNGGLVAFIDGGRPPYQYLWYFGSQSNNPISNTDSLLNQWPGGPYILTVEDENGCELTLASLIISNVIDTTVNIEEWQLGQTLIYPNPTSGLLLIDWSEVNDQPMAVKISTANGKLLQDIPLSQRLGHRIEVDLAAFPGGVYIIQLQYPSGIFSKRIIKW